MESTLLAQIKMLLASLAAATLSITPIPAQQGITTQVNTAPNIGSTSASRNWAGYVATNGNYTSVSGTWTIPQVTTNGHTATDATWVGIGGVSSNDLIQGGTQNVINPSGQIKTTAFYELLPDVSIPVSNLTVKSGDSVTVTISQQTTPSQWLIKFNDNTTNQSYQTTVTYSSSTSSAEWIEEAPSNGRSVLPLDNFGTIKFTNGSTTQNGSQVSIGSSNAHLVTMLNVAGQALATPSALGSDEASFSISRSTAVSNAPIPSFDRDPRGWRRQGEGIGPSIRFFRGHPDNDEASETEPTTVIGQTPTGTPVSDDSPHAGFQIVRFSTHGERHFSFRHF